MRQRERERECVCVCVCVREREREGVNITAISDRSPIDKVLSKQGLGAAARHHVLTQPRHLGRELACFNRLLTGKPLTHCFAQPHPPAAIPSSSSRDTLIDLTTQPRSPSTGWETLRANSPALTSVGAGPFRTPSNPEASLPQYKDPALCRARCHRQR